MLSEWMLQLFIKQQITTKRRQRRWQRKNSIFTSSCNCCASRKSIYHEKGAKEKSYFSLLMMIPGEMECNWLKCLLSFSLPPTYNSSSSIFSDVYHHLNGEFKHTPSAAIHRTLRGGQQLLVRVLIGFFIFRLSRFHRPLCSDGNILRDGKIRKILWCEYFDCRWREHHVFIWTKNAIFLCLFSCHRASTESEWKLA